MIRRCILLTFSKDQDEALISKAVIAFLESNPGVSSCMTSWEVSVPADEAARSWDLQILLTFADLTSANTFANMPDAQAFFCDDLDGKLDCMKAWNFRLLKASASH